MLRRAASSLLPGRVASSQRRGFLTVVLQKGHERAEYKLSVPWSGAVASPSGNAIARVLPPRGGNNDTPRATLKSVEKGGVVASSELMTASEFGSTSRHKRGRERNMVDLHIWPQESRATATIMRLNDKSRWTWQSTWCFNMKEATSMSAEISNSQHEKSLLTIKSSQKEQHLQYKGFIVKEIASEFEVSMKSHFSIKQSLGRGAEGVVFRCVSQRGAHKCAIKRHNSRKPVDQEPREARIMKMLHHPNVKKLYIAWKEDKELCNQDSSVYLAQELCKGTFVDYLDKKTTKDINEKLKIFKEAVLGLSYPHEQGVIHRDIKSSNVFLDAQNHVKIGDFGSGAFVGSSSCLGGRKFWGTQFYASRELWCLNAHSEKTDVFSLGIVYFELFGSFATNDRRCKKLVQLQKVLNSRSWKRKPLATWLKSNVSKGWNGKAELLIRMLQCSPGRRPKCTEILITPKEREKMLTSGNVNK